MDNNKGLLRTIAVVLIVLWLLGWGVGFAGNGIHILLVVILILFLL